MMLKDALDAFASPDTTPDDRRAALTALIVSKVLPKHAEDPSVAAGLALLVGDATIGQHPAYRLLAIAETIRLAQVVKRWLPAITKQIEPAFNEVLPSMQLLADADDRLNLARACAQFNKTWLPDYLAQSIAEEETGEKARSEMLDALLARTASLAAALHLLTQHFKRLRPSTGIPGDTVARRLTRTLVVLRSLILESELEAGDDLGKTLHALLSGALATVGRPQDEKAKLDLAREVLLTVHDIVRTRVSVVADPDMYSAVALMRKLCGGSSWPNELKKALERLITDVSEALILLGRQGRCDQMLLGQLDVLCNYPERARVVARELAVRHPQLPEDVRDWLERGQVRNTRAASDASIEAAASNADESIGLALQVARQARQMRGNLRDQLISSLDIYEPTLALATAELLDRLQVLAVHVEQAAALRKLDIYGTTGEEVEMSVKFFTAIGTTPRQRMLIKQPAVVRKRPDGTVGDVVVKGLVE
jgi:hypothetical protein